MIAKNSKSKRKAEREDLIFKIVLFAVILFFAGSLFYSNFKVKQRRDELTEKINALKEEIENLENKKEKLETGISETQKETYWEEKAREQGYIREGESPVVVIPNEEGNQQSAVSEKWFPERLLDQLKSLLADINPF